MFLYLFIYLFFFLGGTGQGSGWGELVFLCGGSKRKLKKKCFFLGGGGVRGERLKPKLYAR